MAVLTGVAGTPTPDVVSVQGINSGIAVAVSAASLPLPTDAATSAKQVLETPACRRSTANFPAEWSARCLPFPPGGRPHFYGHPKTASTPFRFGVRLAPSTV